jgi:hypothetical protein
LNKKFRKYRQGIPRGTLDQYAAVIERKQAFSNIMAVTFERGTGMQQKKNPLLIVLAVCGGCVLVGIIIGVILVATVFRKGKGMFNGLANMSQNMPKFMMDLQSKNYSAAAALVDPSERVSLSAEKIQHMEEGVEKKLGPMQSFTQQPMPISTNSESSTPGVMPTIVYVYQYKLTYQKGTATADLKVKLQNNSQTSGYISGFTLEPDAHKQGP